MNCKNFRQQLDRFNGEGGALQLSTDMRAHLNSCAVCQAHFQVHQRMLTVLERDPAPALPADFTEKILGRLEPVAARGRAQIYVNWKRVAVYFGSALLLTLALWFGYKNVDFSKAGQFPDSPFAPQLRQWLAAAGATELLQACRRLFETILSFVPTTGNLIEKTFGKEVLPQAFNLTMILMVTYLVAKASVFIEGRVRQLSRRSS